jgi:glycolate oxidase iron-sulfur subunit
MLDLLPEPESAPRRTDAPSESRRAGAVRRRVALFRGCAQDALRPQINDAAIRVLERLGCEVVTVSNASCCGAVAHHLGQRERAHALAASTASVLRDLMERAGVDTIACSASGCGTMLKDYVQVLGDGPDWAATAAAIASRTRDLGELIRELGGVAFAGPAGQGGVRVAVHSPCSIYHGQRLGDQVSPLLAAAGFATESLAEPHLCCGSAGVYNVLQPTLARELRTRKVELIRRSGATVVATGNIGCLLQLRAGVRDAGIDVAVVHAVELMDAATQKSE